MSIAWILLLAATGATPSDTSHLAASSSADPASRKAVAQTGRLAKELREAIADTLHRANATKGDDRAATIATLVELFKEVGKDQQLSLPERQRLGVEIRSRLLRFSAQFQHELARAAQRAA